MSKARTFTRTEIMDAARAAAENGMSVRLLAHGEIEFTPATARSKNAAPTPESMLEGWLNESETRGRA